MQRVRQNGVEKEKREMGREWNAEAVRRRMIVSNAEPINKLL